MTVDEEIKNVYHINFQNEQNDKWIEGTMIRYGNKTAGWKGFKFFYISSNHTLYQVEPTVSDYQYVDQILGCNLQNTGPDMMMPYLLCWDNNGVSEWMISAELWPDASDPKYNFQVGL